MLTCPMHLPIYFCVQPVDFRKSFDGLTGVWPAINLIGGFLLRTRMWWPAELIAPTIVMMEAGFLLH